VYVECQFNQVYIKATFIVIKRILNAKNMWINSHVTEITIVGFNLLIRINSRVQEHL